MNGSEVVALAAEELDDFDGRAVSCERIHLQNIEGFQAPDTFAATILVRCSRMSVRS